MYLIFNLIYTVIRPATDFLKNNRTWFRVNDTFLPGWACGFPWAICTPLLNLSGLMEIPSLQWCGRDGPESSLSISLLTGPICGLAGPLTSDSSINCTNGKQMYLFDGHIVQRWVTVSRTWSKALPHSHIPHRAAHGRFGWVRGGNY